MDDGGQDHTEFDADWAVNRREGLKALVRALLRQAAELGDVAPLLQPGATRLARQLTDLLEFAEGDDIEARFLLGWLHWHRYMSLPEGQDQEDLRAALEMFAACFLAGVGPDQLPRPILPAVIVFSRDVIAAAPDDDPALPEALVRLAGLLRFSSARDGRPGDLDEAIDVLERALDLLPAGSPDRVAALASMGAARRTRFYQSQSPEDLDVAVNAGRELITLVTAQDPGYLEWLSELAAALSARADLSGSPDDFDEMISIGRQLAAADPASLSDWPACIANLAIGLYKRFMSTDAEADLDEAIFMMRRSVAATAEQDARLARRQYWLGTFLRSRFPQGREPADLDEAIGQMSAALAATPSAAPEHAAMMSDLREAEETRSELARIVKRASSGRGPVQLRTYRGDSLADLDEMISLLRPSVAGANADRLDLVVLLAHGLRDRFKLTRTPADLDETISLLARAVAAAPAGQPELAEWLSDLATARWNRYQLTRTRADLDEVVASFQQALADAGDVPQRARLLSDLGTALRTRFDDGGDLRDIDGAVQAARDSLAITPDSPQRAARLASLGISLGTRYSVTGRDVDIREAAQAGRDSVDATPADDPDLADRLIYLSVTMRQLSRRTEAPQDLDEAVDACERALEAIPEDSPKRARALASLGVMLGTRYQRTDDLADLRAGLQASRAAIAATPEGDRALPQRLNELGVTLRSLYHRTGDLASLDEALEVSRRAVAACPDGDPEIASFMSGLAATLGTRFQRTGDLASLDEAVRRSREAIALTPREHADRAYRLDTHGTTLSIRSERTGDLADLSEAVDACREAVTLTPDDHPDRAHRLSTLANVLEHRFKRTGDLTDLDAAVLADEAAVAATPDDHPDRAGRLSNLALTLRSRFEQTRDVADLDEGVRLSRKSVDLTAPDHPELAERLTNLGSALGTRFEVTDNPADLDEAVQAGRDAVRAVPDDHPDRASLLANLGASLSRRWFEARQTRTDPEEAFLAFTEAVNVDIAPPAVRIRAARAASLLVDASQPGLAAWLLEQAVRLLPEVTPRQLRRADQQYALGGLSGLGTDAAALRLADPATPGDERAASALGLLEAGRAILLSQALQVRGDLTDLTRDHPDLATRLTELRNQLDDSAVTEATADRSEVARELSAVLRDIQSRDGYSAFARPPAKDELLREASAGAVVVLNVSRHRSDALLLTGTEISSIPLPGLALRTVTSRTVAFHEALHTAAHGKTSPERVTAQGQLNETLRWLWDAVAGPVLEALGHHRALNLSVTADPDAWPRIWWAPGGLMSLFPLHAAGYHTDPTADPGKRTVLDRVISSYTPTIAALRHARHADDVSPPGFPSAMIVAMPATPGHERLDFARDEARLLADRLPESISLIEPESDASQAAADDGHIVPTYANVLSRLPGHPIAHFACHGVNDPGDPSSSRLFLHDHQDRPLTVASLDQVILDQARLAYLSACETAVTTSTQLIDESIHVASAFQLAGYPHVIGTLWRIHSQRAARIADSFYRVLIENYNETKTLDAAYALHSVVRSNRDEGLAETPYLWASHIHIGA